MSLPQASSVDIKREIASSYPDFEARATAAWHEIINELDKMARVVKEEGVNVSRRLSDIFIMRSTSTPSNSTFLKSISMLSTVFPKMILKKLRGVEPF